MLFYFKRIYASVINCKIIYDKNTKQSKSFGFVDFSNYNEYQIALSNQFDHSLNNHHLLIKLAKGKNEDNDTNSDRSETTTLSSSGNVSPTCRKGSYEIFTKETHPIITNIYFHRKETDFDKTITNAFKELIEIMKTSKYKTDSSQIKYYCNAYLYNKEYNGYKNRSNYVVSLYTRQYNSINQY